MYSFRQASKYERLGTLLLKYPLLVEQLQIVSLANWFQDAGDGVLLVDALKRLGERTEWRFGGGRLFRTTCSTACWWKWMSQIFLRSICCCRFDQVEL